MTKAETPPKADPTAIILESADVDPSTLPGRTNATNAATMAYYDSIVATAPHDKARKYYCKSEDQKGLANRLGRAVKRQHLADVFRVDTGLDDDGRTYVALRPKTRTRKANQ